MGAAKPLVNEITYYLNKLNTEQQKAVLGVVKSFANEEGSWWTDKEYMAGFRYIVSKYFSLSTHYDSDMGWGGGVTLVY